ncbi:unnamed protein product [Amoebophrya sp. A25]|nr:unnamed protein product [Amoebophrya sp. A25]|eukprot:GSA25T00015552001.1
MFQRTWADNHICIPRITMEVLVQSENLCRMTEPARVLHLHTHGTDEIVVTPDRTVVALQDKMLLYYAQCGCASSVLVLSNHAYGRTVLSVLLLVLTMLLKSCRTSTISRLFAEEDPQTLLRVSFSSGFGDLLLDMNDEPCLHTGVFYLRFVIIFIEYDDVRLANATTKS